MKKSILTALFTALSIGTYEEKGISIDDNNVLLFWLLIGIIFVAAIIYYCTDDKETTEKNKKLLQLVDEADHAYTKKKYEKAIDYYHQAEEGGGLLLVHHTKASLIYSQWGYAIASLAKTKKDKILYNNAIVKYEQAIQFYPKHILSYLNWAEALIALADILDDRSLLEEASAKYERAAKIDGYNGFVYRYWSNHLFDWAIKEKSSSLFKQADEILEKEIAIDYTNSTKKWIYGSRGLKLSELAAISFDETVYEWAAYYLKKDIELRGGEFDAEELLAEIKGNYEEDPLPSYISKFYLTVIRYDYLNDEDTWYAFGFAFIKSYNLLKRNKSDEAFHVLDEGLNAFLNAFKLPSEDEKAQFLAAGRETLEKEPMLEQFRADPRFQALIDKYAPAGNSNEPEINTKTQL